ncbi:MULTISPECIES: restriction endonuclease subunit S [Haemophilus]|uniref:Restriction endonuclease subunit S n=1 Tax=Haemophilus parainfluenzae TaxID=729 RepID=A0AB37IGM1_HAEPA|nr:MULTISPECIES: restriction endonuclease subunit S [Haemophilus]OFQ20356.1 hypothetical protein HMPREF2948_07915 [Haemophilus sp. HMSC073C03]RDE92407.1 restriction endonuclease subunit S [Haemophilus parainfluenzae]RDF06687.1 restriction endonuclease subunit S [Haemophilus parainfluenzae]
MKAQQLKNAILQLAIQGKLVPQDPNDEPASELIKCIQSEKERLISEKKIKKPKVKSEIVVRDGLSYEIVNGVERCITDELPFEIPESWCWVRLNDYLDVRDGTHDTPKYVVSGIPLVTSKNLNNGKLDFSNIKYISEEDHKQISLRSGVNVGDILFAMIGSIGNPVLIKENSNFSIKNIGLFKKYISDISMEYVYYMLLKLQGDMRKKSSGGVQSFVSLSFLRDYLIPLPPLNEQKRIVAKIEELLPFIEEYDKKEQKLTTLNQQFPDQLKKSILQAAIQGQLVAQDPNDEPASELIKRIQAEKERLISEKKIKKPKVKSGIVVRDGLPYEIINGVERCIADELPFEIPESWCWMRLSEICSNIHYGYTASASSKGTHKLLRITDIQNNKVSWNDVPFCSLSEKEAENYTLKKGNIVIARTGGTIGKSFLINNIQEQSVFASYLIRIVLLSHVYEKYISYYLNSPFYWEQLRSYSMGTGQPNVNSVSLGCLFIPLPPLSEQKRIVQKIEEVFSHIESL